MSITNIDFERCFECLTDNKPFPWQMRLYGHFLKGDLPPALDLPTGLGKTAMIAVWLLALAQHARAGTVRDFPRRLVYVVNRRTVVDQATREAEQMRSALVSAPSLSDAADALRALAAHSTEIPLAISTLRGQFADNTEWRDDPARAAVIVGTVDMIGSRLLFSGYGRGFKSRPLHAGFLGQDVLLIHDEAHLEPAFQELIAAIESEQQSRKDFRRFRVMALTATSRSDRGQFGLTGEDLKDNEVLKRITAKKWLSLHKIDDENETADQVAKLALKHKDSKQAILVFLHKLEHVKTIVKRLKAECPNQVRTLTGTMRGLERDALAEEDAIFARFMRKSKATPQKDTVYLVCTSAGEVGVDISADHLVCDLTPFDSMAQRLGRVNRFGDGDARVDVVHPATFDSKEDKYEARRAKTLALLRELPARKDDRHNVSPKTLSDPPLGALPKENRLAAFTPTPVIPLVSDILFDAWALTTISRPLVSEPLPGRPPVADWLHGLEPWVLPETHVAWREEIEIVTGRMLERHRPEDLLEEYPLKPHELLRDRTDRVFKELSKLAAGNESVPVWVIDRRDQVRVTTLGEIASADKDSLSGATVLLPPKAGGLSLSGEGKSMGIFSGSAKFEGIALDQYDIADLWLDEDKQQPRRQRVKMDEVGDALPGMRLVRTIFIQILTDEEADMDEETKGGKWWCWYVRPHSADDDGSRTARKEQKLAPHLQAAERFAAALATKLLGESNEARAVTLAAKWHDLGKHRSIWQLSIGNRDPNLVLAKSGSKTRLRENTDYRHELGSLIDVSTDPEFRQLTPEMQDLVLHLIAAHHGRARPHFPADEAFDPERPEERTTEIVREVPRRFARLQRKYGRWGLAYLESLVRAADALASQNDDPGSKPADFSVVPTQEAAR